MTTVKMKKVFESYLHYLLTYKAYDGLKPVELPKELYDATPKDIDEFTLMCHLAWMCQRCLNVFIPLAEKGGTGEEKEKALVWLGYVQGELRAAGHFSITNMRDHNREAEAS